MREGFKIFTKATRPRFYGENNLSMTVTQPSSAHFVFAVPTREGIMSAEFKTDCGMVLGGTVKCQCEPMALTKALSCSIKGVPANPGTHRIDIEVMNLSNKGTAYQDDRTLKTNLRIEVREAPAEEKCEEPEALVKHSNAEEARS